MAKNWTKEEITAAVIAYMEMKENDYANIKYTKSNYYSDLSKRFGRTLSAYEYRMQNISYIYSLLGRDWVKGLKPLENVGTDVANQIVGIINELEKTIAEPFFEFDFRVKQLRDKQILESPKGHRIPQKINVYTSQYKRDEHVAAWIIENSHGRCECCEKKSPFVKADGQFYLEIHHLKRLADGGSDTISNSIAVCPNCHRELHFGKDKSVHLNNIYNKINRLIKE